MGINSSKLVPIRDDLGVWVLRIFSDYCEICRFHPKDRNLIKLVIPSHFMIKYHKVIVTSIHEEAFGKNPAVIKFNQDSQIRVLQARSFGVDAKITVPPLLRDFKANLHNFDTHNLIIPSKHKYLIKGPDGHVYRKFPFVLLAAQRGSRIFIRETCTGISARAIDDYTPTKFISVPSTINNFGLDNKTYGVKLFQWHSPTPIRQFSLDPLMRLEIKRLRLPEGIREISSGGCCNAIEVIIFPKSLEIISKGAFKGMNNLKKIVFHEGSKLHVIEAQAFQNTAIQSLDLPSELNIIKQCAFMGSPLYHLHFDNDSHLGIIEVSAFQNTLLTEVTIPASVRTVEDKAFAYSDMEKVCFQEGSQLIKCHPRSFDHCTAFYQIIAPRILAMPLDPLLKAMASNDISFLSCD